MAALMKYLQLQREDFDDLYNCKGAGGSDRPLSTDTSKGTGGSDLPSCTGTNHKDAPPSGPPPGSPPKRPESDKPSPPETASNIINCKLVARLEAYRRAYLALTPPDNFDTTLYKSVEIVSGTVHSSGRSGTATFCVKFSAQYCNKFGTVHGGAIATLLDGLAQCSTAVVDGEMNEVTMGPTKGKVRGGATRTLQVGFLRPMRVGESIVIVCEILKSGGASTIIRATANRQADGEVLAVCTMEKERLERAKL
jgi:acyl-coenzyme A thioesterase PaaI-like protein